MNERPKEPPSSEEQSRLNLDKDPYCTRRIFDGKVTIELRNTSYETGAPYALISRPNWWQRWRKVTWQSKVLQAQERLMRKEYAHRKTVREELKVLADIIHCLEATP